MARPLPSVRYQRLRRKPARGHSLPPIETRGAQNDRVQIWTDRTASRGDLRWRPAPAMPQRPSGAASEVLFLDPCVPDVATILGNLRPGVEAIVLDRALAPARQMAAALGAAASLDAIHVIAHGAPGQGQFCAPANGRGGRSTITRRISRRLGGRSGTDGDLRLWSCRTGAGGDGANFVHGFGAGRGRGGLSRHRLDRRGGAWWSVGAGGGSQHRRRRAAANCRGHTGI